MHPEVALKLLRMNLIRMVQVEMDNIRSKFIILNDIYLPGSKQFYRQVRWKSKKKLGMLIPIQKLDIDVLLLNDLFLKLKHVIKLISVHRKIYFNWNHKKSNNVLLVRWNKQWKEQENEFWFFFRWRISRHCPKSTISRYSIGKSGLVSFGKNRFV